MQIQKMFERDIDRYINGVISVGEEDTIAQELEEYVVTRELQRHFDDFFEAYERGLDNPARNTGVWIQGYFGSGKSHFLKMLSYLLENRNVNGKSTVSYFDGKFDDPMTYAKIRRAAERVTAETILFNIDEKGGGYKEGDTSETAVLRSIARVFYEHLGFYGRDYKLARFEKMIDDRGKTAEFRAAYEEISGASWLDDRESYDMFGEEVAQAANRAVGLSIQSVTDWADSADNVTVDFGELVDDINEYAKRREDECGGQFRLLFMVDEMGQYLNSGESRMLNLQTLVEQFCDKCGGRVWMVVTSQEAIDEMMPVVSTDFSKIQGRFSTRLSLSSSSVDEVIKRRVLEKTQSAKIELAGEYQEKSAVLKNLFTFEDSRGDLKGYATETEFVESFPFVGYQFTLMPDVLKEIRKHGYQGKSLSTGERSMLSSYQEAAQAVEDGNQDCLVPFWRFFDTLEKELDHGIKQVFERCRKAAEGDYVIQPWDLDVLETLYLINYISDVKPTIGNIAILLIDNIDVDKVALRERVKLSLDRLVRENYVARNGERYSFLTDEEQDVAREIRDVRVDPSQVIESIKSLIFDKIYTARKFRKGANDFPFDRFVDDTIHGMSQGGMKLNIITMANAELCEATDAELDLKSTEQALVVLDTANDYYDVLYNAAKIAKYVKTQNVQQLPETKQRIIASKNKEAASNRAEAEALIADAIVKARVSVNGHTMQLGAVNAKQKIEAVLEELVDSTFTKAGMISAPIENDAQLRDVLLGRDQQGIDGMGGANEEAIDALDKYLEARARTHQPTSMGDVQRAFQAKPYGWREIDVAAVAAKLIADQRAMVTYGGGQVMPTDPKMKDYLRKQSEIDKAVIKKRVAMAAAITSKAKNLLREVDSTIQIPGDEDGLVQAVKDCLSGRIEHYNDLLRAKYRGSIPYPGKNQVVQAIDLANTVLSQQADSESFLREFNRNEDDILDNVEDLEAVERFFNANQANIFEEAYKIVVTMHDERAYVDGDVDVQEALAKVRAIVESPKPYDQIKDLPGLTQTVKDVYGKLVDAKRDDLLSRLGASFNEVKQYAEAEGEAARAEVNHIVNNAEMEAARKRSSIHEAETCSKLDALSSQVIAWHEACLKKIDNAVAQAKTKAEAAKNVGSSADAGGAIAKPAPVPQSKIKVLSRSAVLPAKSLHSEEEVDAYLADVKKKLMAELDDHVGVRLGQ